MACCIFSEMEVAEEAWEHLREYEKIADFGDEAYGHCLYTWDDGKRVLVRCKKCGGYILIQKSEYHGFSDDDSYYTDYFPVDTPEEADELNRNYDGFSIEMEFPKRYLMRTNGELSWSKTK